MFKRIIMVFMFLILVTGCSVRLTDFTVMSSKNLNLSQLDKFERGKKRVEGEDTKVTVILIIPTFQHPTWKEAVDKAIEGTPGAIGLVDGVVYAEGFWLLVGTHTYRVEGTPLIDPSLIGKNELKSNFIIGYHDPDSKKQRLEYVDEEEFKQIKSNDEIKLISVNSD